MPSCTMRPRGALPDLGVTEEQQVAGAHIGQRDAPRARDLARLLRGRAAVDAPPGGQARELEDAPGEARAVIAAMRLAAEVARARVGLAAPDVGHADLRHGDAQRL